MCTGDYGSAAVVGAEVGEVGEGFDKSEVVEAFVAVVVGGVDAAVESVFRRFFW